MKDLLELIQKQDLRIILLLGIIFSSIYMIKKGISALIAKEIEELKAELEKQKLQIEHFHQVSQPTYQKLFEKKINIYQELIKISHKYTIKRKESYNSSPLEDVSDISYQNIQFYFDEIKEIEKTIEGNQLYITIKLLEVYEKLIIKIDEFNSDLNELSLYLYHSNMNDIEYNTHEEKEKEKIYAKIYNETKLEFKEFNKILNNDILKIKKKINLD